MIETTVLRLMIAVTVPIASALVVEQFPKTAVADVPFAFQVADRALPPGKATIGSDDEERILRKGKLSLTGGPAMVEIVKLDLIQRRASCARRRLFPGGAKIVAGEQD